MECLGSGIQTSFIIYTKNGNKQLTHVESSLASKHE